MKKYLSFLVLVLLVVTGAEFVLAQDADVEAKIENAMSAAPMAIAEDATILDWESDADGNFVVLREGSNGWSCLPGSSPDGPMCLDEVFMEWLYALMAGDDLTVTVTGFTYMLQGGVALSNSDPGASEAADNQWLSDSPYMMILLPDSVDLSSITTDPDAPLFVMWADTPYEHIMVTLGDVADAGAGM